MQHHPAHEYIENDLLDKDPWDLVCLLYSKALEKLNQAVAYLDSGDIDERSKAISRAMEILLELTSSLNGEAGGEVAINLARLYEYIFERLAEANAQQKRAPLEGAIRLLSTLHEGWQQAKPQSESQPAPADSLPPEQLNDEGGRAWTL